MKNVRNNYHKLVWVIFVLGVFFSLSGCGSSSSSDDHYHYDPVNDEAWYDEGYDEYSDESSSSGLSDDYDLDDIVDDADYYSTPDSSAFSSVGYNYDYEVLIVEFRTSGTYVYYDVPEDVWEEFLDASSLGGYYNDYIKHDYDWDQY